MKQPGKDADKFKGEGQSDTPEKYMSKSEGSFPSRLVHRRAYEETRREGIQRGRVPLHGVRGGVCVVCPALTLSAAPQTAPRLHICRNFELL
eukprot:2340636-Pleurochrysis_carterae.AAC.2